MKEKIIYPKGKHPNSGTKDSSNHPFRKQNNRLSQYSRKALAEKKKLNGELQ